MLRTKTISRKLEHIKTVLNKDVQFKKRTTMLECVALQPLPESNRLSSADGIDLETKFFGKRIAAPIFVSGMTGGHERVAKINMNIARAVGELSLPMGVGSQRAMIEKPELTFTYDVKKEHDVFLLGNIGASQLLHYKVDDIDGMLSRVNADALAVHTNPGQEVAQPESKDDIAFRGVPKALSNLVEKLDYDIVVKEVGCGISRETAAQLSKLGVYGIDTGGAGGTNWIAVELYRCAGPTSASVFREWGIPTAQSLLEVKSAFSGMVTATGGIRTGADIARCVAMGADACGIAMPVVRAEHWHGHKGVHHYMSKMMRELREEMHRLNCRSIADLRKIKYVMERPLADIINQRLDGTRA